MGNIFTFPINRLNFSYESLKKTSPTGEIIYEYEEYPACMSQQDYENASDYFWTVVMSEKSKIMEELNKRKVEMLEKAKIEFGNKLSEPHLNELMKYFFKLDANGDGLMDYEELNEVLNSMEDCSTEEDRRATFKHVDADNSGAIDFFEFLTVITTINKGDDVDSVLSLLSELDEDIRNINKINALPIKAQIEHGFI